MTAKRPTVDLVQVFCLNLESHIDFSGPKPHWREVEWPFIANVTSTELMDARISRYTLEIFHLALGGNGEHLIPQHLGRYTHLPVHRIANPAAIVKVLQGCDPPLDDRKFIELEPIVIANLEKWQASALKLMSERPRG